VPSTMPAATERAELVAEGVHASRAVIAKKQKPHTESPTTCFALHDTLTLTVRKVSGNRECRVFQTRRESRGGVRVETRSIANPPSARSNLG